MFNTTNYGETRPRSPLEPKSWEGPPSRFGQVTLDQPFFYNGSTTSEIAVAFMVSVSGDVSIENRDGFSVTIPCLAGVMYPIEIVRIVSFGTTASGIIWFGGT